MYLHIGGDVLVKKDSIIGVFDIENTSIGKATREFFSASEKKKHVIAVSEDLPRSFILDKNNTVYLSPISPATLQKRIYTESLGQLLRKELFDE